MAAIALTQTFLESVAEEAAFEPYFEAEAKYEALAGGNIEDEEASTEFVMVRAAYDLCAGPGGKPPAAELLARHRGELPTPAIRALEALLSADDALGRVEVRAGAPYFLRFSDRRTLPCQNVPADAAPLLIGRLVEFDEHFCLLGVQENRDPDLAARKNPERSLLRPLAGVRRILERGGLPIRSERALLQLVLLMGASSPLPTFDAAPGGPGRLPELVNADGHETLFTASYYEVFDLDALARLLRRSPWKIDVTLEHRREKRLEKFEAVVLRKPRGKAFPPGDVVVAHLSATRRRLQVDTNSLPRDLEVRRRLDRIGAGVLRYVRTRTTTIEAVRAKTLSPRQLAKEAREAERMMRDPKVQEELAELGRKYSRWWCDTVVPALGNRKPRTLAKTAAGRTRVLRLLEQLERPAFHPAPDLFDFDLIRAELGLPPRFPVS